MICDEAAAVCRPLAPARSRGCHRPARPLSPVRPQRDGSQHRGERVGQIEIGGIEIDLAGFDLGEIEDVVDEREQGVARFLHHAEEFPLFAESSVSSARSVMPMMPFIGVRISWLMCARKSLLALVRALGLLFGGLAFDHLLLEIARALFDEADELALAMARAPDLRLGTPSALCRRRPPGRDRETSRVW